MAGLVDDLNGRVQQHLQAHGGADRSFYQQVLALFRAYKADVYAGKPRYMIGDMQFTATTDDDTPGSVHTASAGRQVPPASHQQQHHHSAPMSLEDVRAVIEEHRGLELPGFSPYSAVQALISRTTNGWMSSAELLLDNTSLLMEGVVARQVDNLLGRQPAARKVARSAATSLLQELQGNCRTLLRGLIDMEHRNAFTMNRGEFEAHSNTILKQLKEAHAKGGKGAANQSQNGTRSSGGGAAWLSADIGVDQLLTLAAVSVTYFTMSSRRLVDVVPLHIMHYLITRFADQLKGRVAEAMATTAKERAVKRQATAAAAELEALLGLLAEDEATAAVRRELLARQAALRGALAALRAVAAV